MNWGHPRQMAKIADTGEFVTAPLQQIHDTTWITGGQLGFGKRGRIDE